MQKSTDAFQFVLLPVPQQECVGRGVKKRKKGGEKIKINWRALLEQEGKHSYCESSEEESGVCAGTTI